MTRQDGAVTCLAKEAVRVAVFLKPFVQGEATPLTKHLVSFCLDFCQVAGRLFELTDVFFVTLGLDDLLKLCLWGRMTLLVGSLDSGYT